MSMRSTALAILTIAPWNLTPLMTTMSLMNHSMGIKIYWTRIWSR
jgi:hypothetical protein